MGTATSGEAGLSVAVGVAVVAAFAAGFDVAPGFAAAFGRPRGAAPDVFTRARVIFGFGGSVGASVGASVGVDAATSEPAAFGVVGVPFGPSVVESPSAAVGRSVVGSMVIRLSSSGPSASDGEGWSAYATSRLSRASAILRPVAQH
jgi:hypothetical protein